MGQARSTGDRIVYRFRHSKGRMGQARSTGDRIVCQLASQGRNRHYGYIAADLNCILVRDNHVQRNHINEWHLVRTQVRC